jgi:hypothetical protein
MPFACKNQRKRGSPRLFGASNQHHRTIRGLTMGFVLPRVAVQRPVRQRQMWMEGNVFEQDRWIYQQLILNFRRRLRVVVLWFELREEGLRRLCSNFKRNASYGGCTRSTGMPRLNWTQGRNNLEEECGCLSSWVCTKEGKWKGFGYGYINEREKKWVYVFCWN